MTSYRRALLFTHNEEKPISYLSGKFQLVIPNSLVYSPVARSEHLAMFSYNRFFAFFVSPCRLDTESSGCGFLTGLAFL